MDDLISEFLTETNESIEELDGDMVTLEKNPNDKELLSKIFRLMHTIKGTCGFLGLPRLEKVAHSAENLMGMFRDGSLEVTPEYVTLIFESFDRIKVILAGIEATSTEPEGDDSALIAKLDAVYNGQGGNDSPPLDPNMTMEEIARMSEDKTPPEDKDTKPEMEIDMPAPETEEEEFVPIPAPGVKTEEAAPAPEAHAEPEASNETENAATTASSVSNQTLRVNVDVLENLMTMVSELVLTRNQLLQIARTQSLTTGESDLASPLQHLNLVVSELQEGVMQTRMQPIGNAWAKLPRIIRDISMELGKKINLEMNGKNTELDRQVLDLIKDPLTHMVRNSADHGIESPEDRVAAGKPETGKIILNAYHEGGHINIVISDDGKGLPIEKIKAKAIANGLATAEELEEMSTQQINQFIFKAGFSTAEKITSVSGRGVGMDVVRTNIEKIGGSVELNSTEGKGSTFVIKIPLTLAIVSALIVAAGKERFAIPQLAVQELVMANKDGDNRIEKIKGAPVLRLRDTLLPLVTLSELLKLNNFKGLEKEIKISHGEEVKTEDAEAEKPEYEDIRNQYIVVSQVGSYNFGIVVDKVFDTEEIVVKPVAKILRDIDIFSGNTILGDGTVIMILDPNGIAKNTGKVETTDQDNASSASKTASSSEQKTSLLLFAAGSNTPKAVPLSLVARLENINLKDIEYSSDQMMVQYRGELMPLTPFDQNANFGTEGQKPVLVFTDDSRSMGLVVDEIIDIKEEYVDVQIKGTNKGLIGSAIINGKATDVLDVAYFLGNVNKEWFKDHNDNPYLKDSEGNTTSLRSRQKILLVDDSPFFRNMLTPLLSMAGYNVTTLENPLEALKLCENGEDFDLILSDIEMPEMDGFEFAEKIKADSNWQNIPMVALSSHATPQDIDRGKEVGFTKYVAKFDRDTLLAALSQTLSDKAGEAA